MEKHKHQEYRDELAKEINTERQNGEDGRQNAKDILVGAQLSSEYKQAEKWHKENRQAGIDSVLASIKIKQENAEKKEIEALRISIAIIMLVSEADTKLYENFNYNRDEDIPVAPEVVLEFDDPSSNIHIKVYETLLFTPQELIEDLKASIEAKEDKLPHLLPHVEVTITGPDLNLLHEIMRLRQREQFDTRQLGEWTVVHSDHKPDIG